MKQTDILIVGAGAAGLMAAYTLTKAGKTVTVLEARNRIGGRIHTISHEQPNSHVELGAEFIHGNLPVTISLLKEAGISYSKTFFEIFRNNNGHFEQDDQIIDGWNELMHRMHQLDHDMPLHDFLQQYFPGDQYAKMRAMVEGYAMGYDTADVRNISTYAIRNEWENEDEEAQYRIDGGYGPLIEFLADECRKAGNEVLQDSAVKEILWKENEVKVTTAGANVYAASKVVIALPLGVLRTDDTVIFQPSIPEQTTAIRNIGFGSITKILLRFKTAFWTEHDVFKTSRSSATKLLLTSETIPTFWTQSDQNEPLLTGWLGGPPALALQHLSDEAIIQTALDSLGNIFNISPQSLNAELIHWHVADWSAEPFTRGSYAYDTVSSAAARDVLWKPVADTIYFAGEYLYDGAAMGTVEAALTSGKHTAETILQS